MPVNFTDKSGWNPANPAINNVNASIVGQANSLLSASGVTVLYGSNDDLGKRFTFTENEVSRYTNTTNGTLYGGVYQIVLVDASANASLCAAGLVAYMFNGTNGAINYSVTSEDVADAVTEPAGIFLNTVTPGNYTIIQVHGKVNVKLKSTISNGSPAKGDSLFSGGGSGTVDDLATNVTWATSLLSRYLGVALTLPASNTTIQMQIRPFLGRY